MARFFLILMATSFLGALGVEFSPDKIAFKNAVWGKCQKEENAPDEAMRDYHIFKSMEGLKNYKCVVKCVNEEYGVFLKNGTLSKPRLVNIVNFLAKDPKTLEKLLLITEQCFDSVYQISDHCQLNYDLAVCYLVNMEKKKIHLV